jgi:hypothetical protein
MGFDDDRFEAGLTGELTRLARVDPARQRRGGWVDVKVDRSLEHFDDTIAAHCATANAWSP